MTLAMVDQEFHLIEDRVLRDCVVYGELLFPDEDAGGAMYELGPADVVRWHLEEELKARRHADRRRLVAELVVEWDEYCQGYGADGKLVVCVCGQIMRTDADRKSHYCCYDDQPDDGVG